jgi:general secretion pathway protein A
MYAPFYNLVAEPFQLTPDHRFFFASSVHNQALAHLTYGLNQGEGFIVITGDIGAGKTTLVAHLLATLDSRKYVAAKVVTTQLDADDLLRAVVTAFGVKADLTSKADMLRQLEAFLTFNHRSGKRCLLLIDEAQNLTASALEELRMLSNFQVGERAPLQSFILGQPQFRAVLNSPELEQLRQRIIANYHLGPLDVAETQSYIEHRLHTAGWKNDPVLAPDVFAAIHHHTEGVPRRINNLCNRLFLYGFLEEKHEFTADDVERVARDLVREENPDIRGKDLVGLPRDRVTIVPDAAAVAELRQRVEQIEQRPAATADPRPLEDLRRRLDLVEEYVRLRSMADRAFEDLVRRVTVIEETAKAEPAGSDPELDRRLAAAEARLEKIAAEDLAARISTIESAGAAPLAQEMVERLAAAEAKIDSIASTAERLTDIESTLRTLPRDAAPQQLAELEARLAAVPVELTRRLDQIEAAQERERIALAQRCDALEQQIARLGETVKAAASSPAELKTLTDRMTALEQRGSGAVDDKALSALEARLRKVEDRKPAPAEGIGVLQQRMAGLEATQSAATELAAKVAELTRRLEEMDGLVRSLPRSGPAQDLGPRLAAIEDALSTHQAMLRRAIGLTAGLLERGRGREIRNAS